MEIVCWCLAAIALGAYALVYLDRSLYQAFQQWSFQQALERKPANVPGFLAHMIRSGTGARESAEPGGTFRELHPAAKSPSMKAFLKPGSPIGRIEIERVGLQAIIVESTTSEALRRAVGHVEGTALPGEDGNVALAGHRDTFFRGLRDVRPSDIIRIDTLDGSWEYQVESTRVVDPENVEVLKASGSPMLTLVTCYPFNAVGPAPRRYIVQARKARITKPKPSPDF
ncbi:MAG: class D sortase [Rhodospirillales bacterium]